MWTIPAARILAGPLVAIAVAASVIAPAGSALARGAAQSDTSTFDALATQIVADLQAGRFADVRARFDPTMMDQLSEAGLATAWRSYQELFGAFQSADPPSAVMAGELVVEQVPAHLANSDGEIRIVFHPDGTLAGLFFLQPGVPLN